MHMRWLLPSTALAATLLNSGCISLLPKQPPPTPLYALASFQPDSPAQAGAGAGAEAGAIFAIQTPEGPAAMLGDDLVWRIEQKVAFVENAAWSGPARLELAALLADALRGRPGVRASALTADSARADVSLRWVIDAFEVVEADGNAPQAHFVASAQLVDARNRALIATHRVGVSKPLEKRGSAQAARALREAASQGIDELAQWAGLRAQAFVQAKGSAAPAAPKG